MEKNSTTYYKYCIVPSCKNSSRTDPDKVYFNVPKDALTRKKWCKAIGRDNVSSLSTLFCCEDHFNIEKDTNNYIQYKLMTLEHGQKVSLQLKKGVVPYIFPWQKKDEVLPPDRDNAEKRRALVAEVLAEAAVTEAGLKAEPEVMSISIEAPSAASVPYLVDVKLKTSDSKIDGKPASSIIRNTHRNLNLYQVDKAVQVKVPTRSKSVNVNLTAKKNKIALSPLSLLAKKSSRSLLKNAQSSSTKRMFSDSPPEINLHTSVNSQSSVISSGLNEQEHSLFDTSWMIDDESDSDLHTYLFNSLMRSDTLIAMKKEP